MSTIMMRKHPISQHTAVVNHVDETQVNVKNDVRHNNSSNSCNHNYNKISGSARPTRFYHFVTTKWFLYSLIILVLVSVTRSSFMFSIYQDDYDLPIAPITQQTDAISSGTIANNSTYQQSTPAESLLLSQQESSQQVTVYFSFGRGDRSGAVIQEILMCHAYVFQQQPNAVYGGVCPPGTPGWEKNEANHMELIQALGMTRIVPIACPKDVKQNRTIIYTLDNVPPTASLRPRVLQQEVYKGNDTKIWTDEYVQYIQSLITYPDRETALSFENAPETVQNQAENGNVVDAQLAPTIVVHVRRGDIGPCRPKTRTLWDRYLPNSHYLRLIDKYTPSNQKPRVIVFSESESYEQFTDFTDRGYQVILDGSVTRVWQAMISCDILIMSRSSFSLVPGLLTKAKTVVFTPMWHEPLPHWQVVDDILMNQTMEDLKQLQSKCSATSLQSSKLRPKEKGKWLEEKVKRKQAARMNKKRTKQVGIR